MGHGGGKSGVFQHWAVAHLVPHLDQRRDASGDAVSGEIGAMIPNISWPSNTPSDLRRAVDEVVDAIRRETNTAHALPTYADNAAAVAGGLAVGRLYKTGTGEVMVVY